MARGRKSGPQAEPRLGRRAGVFAGQLDPERVGEASYSLSTRTLTVNATSSDQLGGPVLTATGSPVEVLGTLAGGTLNVVLQVPPYQVTVRSSAGGSDTFLVDLTP